MSKHHEISVDYASVPQRLSESYGIVVRQKTQKGEALAQAIGLPFEAANKYRISSLPPNKVVKNRPDDPDGWEPTVEELEQLDAFLFAAEESDWLTRMCFTCFGCKSLRPLRMHFAVAGSTGDVFVIDRPFKLGGVCCCPLEMNLDALVEGQTSRRIGRVREDFSPYLSRCISACCLATTYTDIERALPDGSYEKKYTLRTNLSCCGRVNNCCGATCLKNDAVYDILDMKGEVVAHLQMTYGKGADWLGACCRMGFHFNNYVLEFPHDSSPEDRMLLVTALFQVEYQHFEGQDE
ncbi:hypothetical protein Poli38472_011010 [Pythium oligandrum]|uniref:Phospholipid scramblase n=1 Tax=Pythium oligandrum TaxID=41045 RepID=A0A8K1CQ01_PYTOL|nr:hypothetical protein Poli38472_011010 [Pythium oligandrum]|eukprot:TMW67390.1 hypothetical protein Poli38472_011010 [Pythium oligandrum]